MENDLNKDARRLNSLILINQIKEEVRYVETYLDKLKEKIDELEKIINDGV